MNVQHPLKKIIEDREKGINKGIYSVCSANEYVIKAAMERALQKNMEVLIEATANQVNQYGGYTGMKPADFRSFVYSIGKKTGFPMEQIILGGDHLGPLVWKNEKSESAMLKATELIKQYILAGFTKIHIDTSMHLGGDVLDKKLDIGVIADRGALLCLVAEQAHIELAGSNPDVLHPVYVIGSEVPIPGGSQVNEGLIVTKASDMEETINFFRESFLRYNLVNAWKNVVAVVVQPGVEFGDEVIYEYNHEEAKELCSTLKKFPDIVFEGHSTDYQTPHNLKKMVEDGIAFLKVGPALTFALREALFALNHIENELLKEKNSIEPSGFIEILENVMLKHPENWEKHYHGDERKKRLARKYSYSDRTRYYLSDDEVKSSMMRMIMNLKRLDIPMNLISQYLPVQYTKLRNGQLANTPESLIKDRITNTIDDYYFAVMPQNTCSK